MTGTFRYQRKAVCGCFKTTAPPWADDRGLLSRCRLHYGTPSPQRVPGAVDQSISEFRPRAGHPHRRQSAGLSPLVRSGRFRLVNGVYGRVGRCWFSSGGKFPEAPLEATTEPARCTGVFVEGPPGQAAESEGPEPLRTRRHHATPPERQS